MTTKTITKPLLLLQKGIMRIIGKVSYDEHTDPLFKCYNVLKVNDIYNFECLKFIHSQLFISHDYPIQISSDIHNINTRNRHQIRRPFPETEALRRFVIYYGSMRWNALPQALKDVENETTFKIRFNKYLNILY